MKIDDKIELLAEQIEQSIEIRCLTKENLRINIKQFTTDVVKNNVALHNVSQQRELLIAYEKKHYTPQEWALASKQCIEDIDNFLAINCGQRTSVWVVFARFNNDKI